MDSIKDKPDYADVQALDELVSALSNLSADQKAVLRAKYSMPETEGEQQEERLTDLAAPE